MRAITIIVVVCSLAACSYDLTALQGTGDSSVLDRGAADAQLGDTVVASAIPSSGNTEKMDARLPTDAMGTFTPDVPATLRPDGMLPPIDMAPEPIGPHRNGVACTRDDQCGHPTFVDGKMKCIAGVCTACVGTLCGMCESGPARGYACPVRGTTASACGACAGDAQLWCTPVHACTDGSKCLLSSCI